MNLIRYIARMIFVGLYAVAYFVGILFAACVFVGFFILVAAVAIKFALLLAVLFRF